MIITGNQIQFKSNDIYFEKERSGTKNNTFRIMEDNEKMIFLNSISYIKHIKITTSDQSDYFEREIKDISIFELNKPSYPYLFIVIFTW